MKVVVETRDRRFARLRSRIRKTALKIGRLLGLKRTYVEIFLVGNEFMNKNVWAFPAAKKFPRPDIKEKSLGEIYLNPDYIEKHDEDLVFMLVHGTLHLLGYDHEKKNDTIIMQKKEQQLLGKL